MRHFLSLLFSSLQIQICSPLSYLTSLKNSSRTSVKTLKEELWNNHLEPIIKDYIKGSEDKIEDYKSEFVDSKKEDSKNDAS